MKYIWRSVLVLTGILILALSAPHESPWAMKYIKSAYNAGNTLVNVQLFGSELPFSIGVIWRSLFMVAVALILLTPSARRCLSSAIAQPRRLVLMILPLAYLIFSLQPSHRGWEMVLYLLLGASGITMILVGASQPVDALIIRLRESGKRVEQWFYGMPAWSLLSSLFAIIFTVTNLVCYFVFNHIPHIVDSVDQMFHGKIFLLGKLTVPSPEPREFFEVVHMINNGKWYSQYPPGHSLLFSIGHLIHAPWIINPLFGSLCMVLLYFIGKEIYNERLGRLAALLGTLSPFLIFMSSGFMNHTTTLFFIELFMLGFARTVKRGRFRDALLAGFSLGYAINIRPMTTVALGAPFAIYGLFRLVRLIMTSRKESIRFGLLYLTAIAMFGVMLAGLFTYNYITNGDPFLFGYTVLHGTNHNPGFGPRGLYGVTTPYTPQIGLTQMLMDLNALNKYLFEIPIPALFLVILALILPRANIWDLLLILSAASLVFAYFFYWFQCWGFGPRFTFESTGALLILAARGISGLPDILHRIFGIADKYRVKGYVAVALILCFCLGFSSNIPPLLRTYSDSYWGVDGKWLRTVREAHIKNAVVFVENSNGYESVFPENHPYLKSDIIYVLDLGKEKNKELMKKFPDRKFYILDSNSIRELKNDSQGG